MSQPHCNLENRLTMLQYLHIQGKRITCSLPILWRLLDDFSTLHLRLFAFDNYYSSCSCVRSPTAVLLNRSTKDFLSTKRNKRSSTAIWTCRPCIAKEIVSVTNTSQYLCGAEIARTFRRTARVTLYLCIQTREQMSITKSSLRYCYWLQ